MNHNFNIEKIHDTIWVFKNAYPSGSEIINYYESLPPFADEYSSENWEGWYAFGDHRKIFTPGPLWDSFPDKESFMYEIFDSLENPAHKNEMVKKVLSVFYDTTRIYMESQKISLPNWKWEAFDIASYNPGAGSGPDHGMAYHSDFQPEKKDEPGSKFAYTCLIYLNDNYDDGEIVFKELSEDLKDVIWRGRYKPSEGDVVVFPSGHPIYHATKKCQNGKKYLLRLYWRYESDGSAEYWEEKSKYQNEEEWELYLKEKRKNIGYALGKLINNSDSNLDVGNYE